MKPAARNIILFFIFLHSSAAHTQTTSIDSLKKVLVTQKNDTSKVWTLINLSDAYKLYYPDSSLVYAQNALTLSEKLNNDYGIFWSEVEISDALMFLGNYLLELEYCFTGAAIAKKINDPYILGWSDGMLSDYYYNVGEYNTSLEYYRKVVRSAEQSYPDEVYIVWTNFSRIFEAMHQPDSALLYAKKAYERIRHNDYQHIENIRSRFEKSYISLFLGNAFAGKAEYDSALFYYRMSLPVSLINNLETNIVGDYNGIAAVYKATGKPDSAIWYAKKTIAERIGKSYPTELLKAANMLTDIYESQQKNDSALKYLKLATGLKDSLFNREKMIAIKNLTAKEQEKQNEIAAAKIKLSNKYTMYFLLAGFIMLLLIAGIIIRNKRQKQLQNMRNSIAADLHDDIGSTLINISILSELSKQSIDPENNAGKFLTRINEEINTTSQALDDIIWSVNVHNDSIDEIMLRMRRYSGELFDADGINYTLDFDDKLSGMKISMEQRHDFYLIFKEALNNIYKHANASCVNVSVCKKDQHIVMRIEDNGSGIEVKNLHRNGLTNMQSRAEKWGGNLHIESGKNKGTIAFAVVAAACKKINHSKVGCIPAIQAFIFTRANRHNHI